AEAYRDHLFKLLWRACSAFEKPSIGARVRECLAGRRMALELFARQDRGWSAGDFVAHAHRASLSLERRSGNNDKPANFDEAAELSTFCLQVLCSKEGEDWPANDGGGGRGRMDFQPAWVDWLQYTVGLLEKVGDGLEAQRLLQLAYEYVRRCSKQATEGEKENCGRAGVVYAAYSGMLKIHAAATTSANSSRPFHRAEVATAPAKRQAAKAKPRVGNRAASSPDPTCSALIHTSIDRGLGYLGIVRDYLETLASAKGAKGKTVGVETGTSGFVGSVVKAWKWTQKSCAITATWVEKVKAQDPVGGDGLGLTAWSALYQRGLQLLGDLSWNIASFSERAPRSVQDKIPAVSTLAELGFDSYLRSALTYLNALSSVTQILPAVDAGSVRSIAAERSREDSAREALMAAEGMCEGDALTPQHTRRVGAGWFGLGQALLDGGKVAVGLDALVRGCRVLESWVKETPSAEADDGGDGVRAAHVEILRLVQLDVRLSKLSKVFIESGEFAAAAAAVARALAFCPDLWNVSSDGRLENTTSRGFASDASLPTPEAEEEIATAGVPSATLLACVEGSRRATEAVLRMCTGSRTTADIPRKDHWEAQARVLSAWFEHDLFLVNVAARKGLDAGESCEGSAAVMADLHAGIERTVGGSATTVSDKHGRTPSSKAIAGVCACIRAMLLRDLADPGDGVKEAMHTALDSLDDAVKSCAGSPKGLHPLTIELADTSAVVSSLEVLEAHYTLHRDTRRMVKSAELKVVLSEAQQASMEPVEPPATAASTVGILSTIGVAYHSAGIPKLVHIFSAAVEDKLGELMDVEECQVHAELADVEAARVSADTLRGLCLGERTGGAIEAEKALLEARRAVSGERKVDNRETAAFLECMVGLSLSWLYERCGRLAEAVGELRHVLQLCHAWASCGGPFFESDRQVVSLSASKGASVHDERPGAQATAGGFGQAEEGVGDDSREVEASIGKRQQGGLALSSRWIPVYLEGLARMGRLWRARGFASKASGYLRQGCVVSEPLRASRLLRSCLREEVEVAVQTHHFDRANRLLGACQTLLEQERRDEMVLASPKTVPSDCATCKRLFAKQPEPSSAPSAKGRGPKRAGAKTEVPKGKVKTKPPPTVAASAGGLCLRCREFSLSAAELLVIESDVLRRQGDFTGALSACDRGHTALAPLMEATAWGGVRVDSALKLEHAAATVDLGDVRGEECDLGWRALEILSMLRLHQGRTSYLLGNSATARDLLQKCASADGAPVLVRAAALYRLGRMHLDSGDISGAKGPLRKAEVLTRGVGAPKLVRRVRRALAVALTEPERGRAERREVGIHASWSVAALSSLSVGITHCNQVVHKAVKQTRKGAGSLESCDVPAGVQLFGVVSGGGATSENSASSEGLQPKDLVGGSGGTCLSEAVASELREEWPIVSLCLSAGDGGAKHLLLTRLARGCPPLTASVPLSAEDTKLLKRWRGIMEENWDTLRGHTAEEASTWGNKEKAAWWERRTIVDKAVGCLLNDLEGKWLEAHGLAPLLLGKLVNGGLEAALDNVYEFAKERVTRARRVSRGGTRGKGPAKRKAGGQGRSGGKSRVATRTAPVPEVEGTLAAATADARDSGNTGERKTAQGPAAAATSNSLDEALLSKMKVAELRAQLSSRGIEITTLKRKSDLLAKLTEAVRQEAGKTISVSRGTTNTGNKKGGGNVGNAGGGECGRGRTGAGAERHPVVLVLDEELQAMPWEALPCLRGHAVTRCPAVPFVFAALATRWAPDTAASDTANPVGRGWVPSRDGVRLNRGFYVLDPEANLSHTRKHLGPVFDGIQSRLGWSGTRGKAPSEGEMTEALQGTDVFVYCGHGAGELLVGREAVSRLTRCAVAVLMGCSSGRLKGYGDFEPSGMASSYLVGGSPAVVANLWDVTDRDIDRFSVALLDLFVEAGDKGEKGPSKHRTTLAHSVARARLECKMTFIIGHAPVCYGIPVAVAGAR
ncbi:unnamed protein product, partial [Sphacelaria rigidula]